MKNIFKNYGFIISMLLGIGAGCIFGWLWPEQAGNLAWLGTIFTNMMFCVVVPMVFCSICSAIANMESMKKAGKIMGVTVATFCVTAGIAALIMYFVCRIFPLVQGQYTVTEGEVGETLGVADMIVNFFTKPDFTELWSRRAILPLIVFAVLCGFGIQMSGGKNTMTAKLLEDVTGCIMNVVKIITYYAPIGFFGFFANLVADYGPALIGDYSRTLIIYYVLCFAYMFTFFPVYARFGGGKGAVKVMFSKLFKPAAVSFGTCSSVATIPTNMEAAFLFGIFGKDFGTGEAILAIIVAIFSSVAMSGIPGGGGTGELVLCTIFFPDQMAIAYPIAIALGNLVDPPATMLNAAGDYVVSYIVERFVTGRDWLQKHLNK